MARTHHDNVHIEWRGGTCRVKWWTGEYLPSGRKRFESRGGFRDEDSAYQYGHDQMYEIRHGTHVSNRDGSTSMSEWLDYWESNLDHGPLTERGYRSIIKNHIRPYFQGRAVSEVDVIAYRAFKKHVTASVGSGAAKNVMMVLGMILDDAVPNLIRVSPVERRRRRGKYEKTNKRERKRDMTAADIEQLARNAEQLMGFSGYVFFWTMAATGMRPGELFGLTRDYCYPNWPASDPREDPDEEDRYEDDGRRYGKGDGLMPAIRVQRQVQYVNGALEFLPPKYLSCRTLVVPPFLANMLEELLKSHDQSWVFTARMGGGLGSVNFDHAYWRPAVDGADERPSNVARWRRPALPAVAPFQGKRLYLLRHGAKTWLDEDGHSKFAVESRMGHEVPGVEGVYSSVTVPMERAIMKTLQARFESLHETHQDHLPLVSQSPPPEVEAATGDRPAEESGQVGANAS